MQDRTLQTIPALILNAAVPLQLSFAQFRSASLCMASSYRLANLC
jgi:hypothetical protein